MTDKIIILRDLKNCLRKLYNDSVREVILFGSQALNAANENSDFDVLILLDKDYSGKDENQILDICYEIDLKYNIIIDAHLLSVHELSTIRGKQTVFVNAINSGIYA
jgi:predicted nucleotidyltransferase